MAKIEELAEMIEKTLGISRVTTYMAFEEAFFLGAESFSLHLCNHIEAILVIKRMGEEARISEIGLRLEKEKLGDIPLDSLEHGKIRVKSMGSHSILYLEVSGLNEVLETLSRITGISAGSLRECGYSVPAGGGVFEA